MFQKTAFVAFALVFFSNINTSAQKPVLRQFFDLSCPEIWWVVTHPFSAPDAYHTANEARAYTDSLRKSDCLDGDPHGGKLDAFKHTYWMARLGQEIKIKWARKLGKAHEKGNKITFYESPQHYFPANDSLSSAMDLWNNNLGLELSEKNPGVSSDTLCSAVMEAVREGKARIIKKDSQGHFLDKKSRVIPKDKLKGNWVNPKVLVPSNYDRP